MLRVENLSFRVSPPPRRLAQRGRGPAWVWRFRVKSLSEEGPARQSSPRSPLHILLFHVLEHLPEEVAACPIEGKGTGGGYREPLSVLGIWLHGKRGARCGSLLRSPPAASSSPRTLAPKIRAPVWVLGVGVVGFEFWGLGCLGAGACGLV